MPVSVVALSPLSTHTLDRVRTLSWCLTSKPNRSNLTVLSSLRPLGQVYRFTSEATTFLRNCGDLLDMSSHSDTAIMRRLETVLEGRIDVESEVCLRVSHDAGSWKASR